MSYIAPKVINGVYQNSDWAPNANTRAYWKLSDDILDYSGNGFHLKTDSVNGSEAPVFKDGKFGNAPYFNKSTSLLYYENASNLILASNLEFTYSAWVKMANVNLDGGGFWISNGGGQNLNSSMIYSSSTSTVANWASSHPNNMTNNIWSNVILTHGNGITTAYCDGLSGVTTTSNEIGPTPDNGVFTIGMASWGFAAPWTYGFQGNICEVIVENVCWSPETVGAYYNKYK